MQCKQDAVAGGWGPARAAGQHGGWLRNCTLATLQHHNLPMGPTVREYSCSHCTYLQVYKGCSGTKSHVASECLSQHFGVPHSPTALQAQQLVLVSSRCVLLVRVMCVLLVRVIEQ